MKRAVAVALGFAISLALGSAHAAPAPEGACHSAEKVGLQSPPANYGYIVPWFNALTLTAAGAPGSVYIKFFRVIENGRVVHEYSYVGQPLDASGGKWARSPGCIPDDPALKLPWTAVLDGGALRVDVDNQHQIHGWVPWADNSGRLAASGALRYSAEALVKIEGPVALQLGVDFWNAAKTFALSSFPTGSCTNQTGTICEGGYSDWLLGPTEWTLMRWPQTRAPAPARSDLDLDHDTIVWDDGVGHRWLYRMDRVAVASAVSLPATAPGWEYVARGDFNGDHHIDILYRDHADPTHYWITLMNGQTVIGGGSIRVVDGYFAAYVADFDGDGRADILWENAAGDRWIYRIGAASVSTVIEVVPLRTAMPGWVLEGVGDFNGDHQADLLWQNGADATQYLVELRRLNTWLGSGYVPVASGYRVSQLGDFDGDGNTDILWENGNGGRWIYAMNGFAIKDIRAAPAAAPGWVIAGTGDFNGDHKTDLLWQNAAQPTQYWIYLLNGASVIGSGGVTVAPGYAAQPWYGF